MFKNIIQTVNIQSIVNNVIDTKIIPINLVYYPTTYKSTKSNSDFIQDTINLIKKIIGAISLVGLSKKILKLIKHPLKVLKKILLTSLKVIFKPIKYIAKLFGKIISCVCKPILKLSKFLIKNIIKFTKNIISILKKIIIKIKNIIKKVIFNVIKIVYNTITKIFKFIKKVVIKSYKIIKFLIRLAKKFANSPSRTFKYMKGAVVSSSLSIVNKLKNKLKNIVSNTTESVGKVFSPSNTPTSKPKPKTNFLKSIGKKIKDFVKPLLNAAKPIGKWFLEVGSLMKKSATIFKHFAHIFMKIFSKLLFTAAATAVTFSGIFSWAGVLAFLGKWTAGFLLGVGLSGMPTWRIILSNILNNMPYFDIIFVLSELIGSGPFSYFFNLLKSCLGLKDDELDNPLISVKENKNYNELPIDKISSVGKNYEYIDNISNSYTKLNIDKVNILNIVEELSYDNTDKRLFINIINKHFNRFITIMDNRNTQLLIS